MGSKAAMAPAPAMAQVSVAVPVLGPVPAPVRATFALPVLLAQPDLALPVPAVGSVSRLVVRAMGPAEEATQLKRMRELFDARASWQLPKRRFVF